MLPLPVSYDCSQQQRNDGHEVKVPLRSQKLVHIKLGEHISNLNENNIETLSLKCQARNWESYITRSTEIKIIGFKNILQCVCVFKAVLKAFN